MKFRHATGFLLSGFLILMTIQSTPASGSTTGVVQQLWPQGKMPGKGADLPETVLPSKGDHVQRITNVSQPTLTIFKAPGQASPRPAMVVCPGGAYALLAFNLEGTEIASWLNSLGVTALVLKYRVPGNREGAFQDVQRALRLARLHAADWAIDPHRLGVIGFSAGGHLAARLSSGFAQAAYPKLDAADQLSCRPDFTVLVYPAYLQVNGELAPELEMSAGIPPTLIVHTKDDKAYEPGSEIYHAALDAAKVPSKFLLYNTGGHGYGVRSKKEVGVWPGQAAEWMHGIGML